MYTTTVKVRKIFEGKRATIIVLTPLIWGLLVITSLIIGVKVTQFALLAMIVLFIGGIPMIIILRKASEPYRGTKSFETKDVTFRVEEGVLYTEDIQLDVDWDEVDKCFYLENTSVIEHPRYKTKTYVTRFAGVVEEPFAKDFLSFLKSENVKMC